MDYKQPSLFNADLDTMYDGYEVQNDANILIAGSGLVKLTKGQIFYLVVEHMDGLYSVAMPNRYGGSIGFTVTSNQFKRHFKYIGKKVYPYGSEIWNGIKWINVADSLMSHNKSGKGWGLNDD